MSKDWENTVANEMHRSTDDWLRPYRCGYSGNSAIPQPDVLLTDATDGTNYALELKGPIKSERLYIEAEDIQQLVDCTNATTVAYFVVKFQNRRPVVIRYAESVFGVEDFDEKSDAEKLAYICPAAFDPHVTDSGNLRLDKPSLDDWPSATASADAHLCIMSDLGIVNENSVEADGSILHPEKAGYTE
jgi:Holliday junction resolvase